MENVLQGLLVACMMDADRLRTDARQEGEEQGDPMGEDGQPLPPQDGLSQHLLCKAYFDERASQCAPSLDVVHMLYCLTQSHGRSWLGAHWLCSGGAAMLGWLCMCQSCTAAETWPVCLVLQTNNPV